MTMREKKEVLKDAQRSKMRVNDIVKVYDFVSTVSKKFGTFVKAVAVFGSFARKRDKDSSDIDLLVIVDDSFAPLDKALYVAFNSEMSMMLKKYPKFHLNTVTISQFWDFTRRGDPLAIQVLRDGIALIDLGFFAPLKRLLIQGKIKPTDEAISAALSRAFFNINGYNSAILGAANALYWAAVEVAHAGIMKYGRVPGSPWEVSKLLKETLVKDKVLTLEDVRVYEETFSIEKGISKGELKTIDAKKLEELHEKVIKFISKIDAWVNAESLRRGLSGK